VTSHIPCNLFYSRWPLQLSITIFFHLHYKTTSVYRSCSPLILFHCGPCLNTRSAQSHKSCRVGFSCSNHVHYYETLCNSEGPTCRRLIPCWAVHTNFHFCCQPFGWLLAATWKVLGQYYVYNRRIGVKLKAYFTKKAVVYSCVLRVINMDPQYTFPSKVIWCCFYLVRGMCEILWFITQFVCRCFGKEGYKDVCTGHIVILWTKI